MYSTAYSNNLFLVILTCFALKQFLHGENCKKMHTHVIQRLYLVLVWYITDCMVSINNINNGITEPTTGCQNCNTSQMLIFGGCGKVEKF